MNAVRSNNVSLKYQRFTSSGYKVKGFTKIEFVAKSQFLCFHFFMISARSQAKISEIELRVGLSHTHDKSLPIVIYCA